MPARFLEDEEWVRNIGQLTATVLHCSSGQWRKQLQQQQQAAKHVSNFGIQGRANTARSNSGSGPLKRPHTMASLIFQGMTKSCWPNFVAATYHNIIDSSVDPICHKCGAAPRTHSRALAAIVPHDSSTTTSHSWFNSNRRPRVAATRGGPVCTGNSSVTQRPQFRFTYNTPRI